MLKLKHRGYQIAKEHAYGMTAKYGITYHAFWGLFDLQEGKCRICWRKFDKEVKAVVDHCHQTGRIRGLLCNRCNTGLGFFLDSENLLVRAIQYLDNTRQ